MKNIDRKCQVFEICIGTARIIEHCHNTTVVLSCQAMIFELEIASSKMTKGISMSKGNDQLGTFDSLQRHWVLLSHRKLLFQE